ncbi:hypothetical protein ABI061_15155, partial [Enterococcus faecium]|uniref:hypothetical protein n=1 Tax=Enterococcus faecium TaxID=1352 RepID=UPI003F435DC6
MNRFPLLVRKSALTAMLSLLLLQEPLVGAGAAFASTQKPTLSEAILLIDTNPRAAERALRLMKEPLAKGYLAYLYLDKKSM